MARRAVTPPKPKGASRFRGKLRINAYKKLSLGSKRGLPLADLLRLQRDHASDDGRRPNDPVARAYESWIVDVETRGTTLADAMVGWVPSEHVMLIRAGERSDTVAESFALCAYVDEAMLRITSSMRRALSYPIFLIILVAGLLIFMGIVIAPALEQLVPQERWRGISASFPPIFGFLTGWGIGWLAAGIVALLWAYRHSLPRWRGPVRLALDRYFPWSVYRQFRGAEFVLAFSAQLQVGTEAMTALAEMRRYASPWLAERIDAVLENLRTGAKLSDAMYTANPHFPDTVLVRDLRSIIDAPDFEDQLQRVAREFVDEIAERFTSLEGRFRNFGIFVAFGALVWVMAGMREIFEQAQSVF